MPIAAERNGCTVRVHPLRSAFSMRAVRAAGFPFFSFRAMRMRRWNAGRLRRMLVRNAKKTYLAPQSFVVSAGKRDGAAGDRSACPGVSFAGGSRKGNPYSLHTMKKYVYGAFALFFALLSGVFNPAYGCTSVVVSGKITRDGRPLLWKNRDTDYVQNAVKYFTGQKYSFIAIVNSAQADPDEIWIGTNSAGFSIMNTQSYNLVEIKPGEERGAANGRVMRRALEVCGTVDDFKVFLDTLSKPSLIEANFGVIDAQGGAAMFEVGYYDYTMFDANDPKDAPLGYVARTNFSFSGELNGGSGYVRYMNEDVELMRVCATGGITPAWIFSDLSRCFKNQMLGIDLKDGAYNTPRTTGWFLDKDFIPRKSTGSAVVVQGVKKGEDPSLTVMWTLLNYPPAGVAVPLWVKNAGKIPPMMLRDAKTGVSPLCDKAMSLRNRIFSYRQGSGTGDYFNWELIYNPQGTGCMQLLAPVERAIFERSQKTIDGWYAAGEVDVKQMNELYAWLEKYVTESYDRLFGL